MNEQDQKVPLRFASIGRTLLFIFAGAVPLWFVPWRINVDFGREMTFLLLILGAFVLWLLTGLLMGRFRFVTSVGFYAGALFLVAASVSTLVSKRPFASAFLSDPSAEKWSTLLAGFLLMIVTANVLVSRKDVARAVIIFLLAAGVQAAVTFFSLAFHLSAFRAIAPFVQGDDFNVIGTINGAVLLYATGIITALGFILASLHEGRDSLRAREPAFHQLRAWIRWALYAAIFFFGANLLLVHFRTAWILLFVGSLFLSGFMFWMSSSAKAAEDTSSEEWNGSLHPAASAKGWKYALSLVVLAFSLVMLMVPGPIVGKISLPAEVSPSAMTTLRIARSVYREGVVRTLFGSGPATFDRDWMRYKDAAINATPFWGTQFNQGYSLITTLAGTTGIVGVVLFLLFVLGFLVVALRSLLALRQDDAGFLASVFLGLVGMVCIAALYPANIAFVLLLFFFAGLLMAGLSITDRHSDPPVGGEESPMDAHPSWLWGISERWVAFQQPWAVFAFSLAIVLILSLSIGMLYYEVTRIQSAFAQTSGLAAVAKGDLDAAIASFERAVGYESKNARAYQALVQLRTEKIRTLIAAAAQGKNVQNDFQQTLQTAIQNSQAALVLSPEDPALWQTQGALYETIIPYIPGADRLAFASYQKEIELDPLNPVGRVDLARAGLVAADRIQLTLNQQKQKPEQQGVDVAQLTKARSEILEQIEKVLQEAVGIKADLAAAHFLLAQTALRTGNVQKAIQSTENTKRAAPFDIGVAFQLGLLYYQNNNLDLSAGEFERAISLNQQYSNARYFLGLIYSRLGSADKAIAQFEEIAKYNPDNQEVKQILENLRLGRPALDNIAPPATPPEQRREPPVAEGQQSAGGAPTPKAREKKQ